MGNEQLISFKTAKLAKEKGFDIPVLFCYNENEEIGDVNDYMLINFNQFPTTVGSNTNMYSVPTQSLLQKWLRDVHNIVVTPITDFVTWECNILHPDWNDELILRKDDNGNWFNSYEDALEEGLYEALNQLIIK